MKQLLTAILAGVGLLAGLNAAIAAGDHATQKAAPEPDETGCGQYDVKGRDNASESEGRDPRREESVHGLRKQHGKFRGAEAHEQTA